MTSEQQLEEAVARLRTVVSDLGAGALVLEPTTAGWSTAAREALEASLRPALEERTRPLAERLARLESRLDELARVLGGLDKSVRAAPATELEAIADRLRGEFARERARRQRAALWLLALALLAGAAGWLWGDALDLPGLLEAAGERAAALVESARTWLGGV